MQQPSGATLCTVVADPLASCAHPVQHGSILGLHAGPLAIHPAPQIYDCRGMSDEALRFLGAQGPLAQQAVCCRVPGPVQHASRAELDGCMPCNHGI